MTVHRRTGSVLRRRCAAMTLTFATCAIDIASADIPMSTRHVTSDGGGSANAWGSHAESLVSSVQPRAVLADRGAADARAVIRGDDHRRTRDALFRDGFQPHL